MYGGSGLRLLTGARGDDSGNHVKCFGSETSRLNNLVTPSSLQIYLYEPTEFVMVVSTNCMGFLCTARNHRNLTLSL